MINTTDVTPSGVATSLETNVIGQPEAGTPLKVDCTFLDNNGEPVSPPSNPETNLVYSPEEKFEENDANQPVPVETGEAEVACAARGLSLVDDSPETFEIAPGPPHTVRTTLDNNKVTAGTTVEATCGVWDEHDNPLPKAKTSVEVNAMGSGIQVKGKKVTITKADLYEVTCTTNGAKKEVGAPLEVNPALPTKLAVDPVPKKSVYGLGEVVRFVSIATDQYGNEVRQAKVGYGIQPSATPFGSGRWEFNQEGTYTITGTVQSKTKNNKTLSESETIIVNGEGPSITCKNPSNGSILDRNTSGSVTFKGSVSDTHSTKSVKVNGSTVNVSSNGSFSTSVSVDFGVNFVDISATDQYGAENSRTCAFLVSDDYHKQDDYMSDTVALELRQDALDDGYYSSQYDSLADVLDTVLNSSQLVEDLGNVLLNAGTLFTKSYLGGTITFKAEYEPKYSGQPESGLELGSSDVDLSMDWQYGEIEVETTIGDEFDGSDDLRVRLDLDGTCDQDFWVHIDELELRNMDVDVSRQFGKLDATLQSVTVDSGTVDPKLSGLCGWVQNRLQGFLQDTYQKEIEDKLQKKIKNEVGSTLDDLFSSLDVSTFGNQFSVPRLDGNGSVSLDFNLRYSSLDISTSRALIGVGTEFNPGSTQVATPSKGVPVPSSSALHNPSVSSPDTVGASVYIGVVNHILHALWRGGLFDAKVGSALLGNSAPQGTSADLSVSIPPVAKLNSSGDVEMMIGGAELKLTYPGIFDNPVVFDVGVRATTGMKLKKGDKLKFKNITIQELYFTPQQTTLSSKSRTVLESFLKTLFQNVVDRALNKGLPALPIPSFTISSNLGKYGLPQGQDLGLKNPSLSTNPTHFILKGKFGKK